MANYVIGIDLGGTNTVIGLVDVDGNILAKDDSVKTQKYAELNDYADAVVAVINKLAAENSVAMADIEGIGVGAPMGNYYTGDIENAANLPWKGRVPLGRVLTEKSGLPARVTNDANAAACLGICTLKHYQRLRICQNPFFCAAAPGHTGFLQVRTGGTVQNQRAFC